MMKLVSRCVRSRSLSSLPRRTSRTFVTKKEETVDNTKNNRVANNLVDASTDVYLCCDINLVACLLKNDVKGFPGYFQRILEDNPGEFCHMCAIVFM